MPLCCLDRLTPRYLVSRSLFLAIKFPDPSVLVSKCLIFLFAFSPLSILYRAGWDTGSRDEESYYGTGWCYGHDDPVLLPHRRAVQRSQLSTPQFLPHVLILSLFTASYLFLSGLLPIQVKSSRTIPRVSKATMIYSVSLNLMSSMRYTRYVYCFKKWAHVLHMLYF